MAWEIASHGPEPPSSHAARQWSGSTRAPAHRPAGAVYRPRRLTETPLYPVVQHHLDTFLAETQDANPMGWGVRSWVEVSVYLSNEVIPHLPVRQWVLSAPRWLRPFLHQTPEVAEGGANHFPPGAQVRAS